MSRDQFIGDCNMTDATVLTDRFDRALLYATHVHGGQVRKGTPIPYIAHLLAVAATVLEYDGSEDMAIAALLHDAVEDQGGEPRLSDIRNRFGDRVADTVRSCSDTVVNSSAGQQKEDWHTRKKRYVEHLNLVDQDTLLVSLSDKIHNARSILRDLRRPEIGKAVWDRFKNSRKDTLWYYRELAKSFQKRLKDQSAKMQLADELSEIVDVSREDLTVLERGRSVCQTTLRTCLRSDRRLLQQNLQ
jgi:(p)ppGpp synthase/HD superfamily hydrolase